MNYIYQKGPDLKNLYYTYYATQAMFQYTEGEGSLWQEYNLAMRESLIASQSRQGHEAGSWALASTYLPQGGRIYCTSMACMCLEIYYRHMPVYKSGGLGKHKPGKR
jgi:hypothetical protein